MDGGRLSRGTFQEMSKPVTLSNPRTEMVFLELRRKWDQYTGGNIGLDVEKGS